MVYLNVLDRFETPAYERAWRYFRQTAPWMAGLRNDYRAGLFRSVEWLAARMQQWERQQGGAPW
jgi:hypothetical protein